MHQPNTAHTVSNCGYYHLLSQKTMLLFFLHLTTAVFTAQLAVAVFGGNYQQKFIVFSSGRRLSHDAVISCLWDYPSATVFTVAVAIVIVAATALSLLLFLLLFSLLLLLFIAVVVAVVVALTVVAVVIIVIVVAVAVAIAILLLLHCCY